MQQSCSMYLLSKLKGNIMKKLHILLTGVIMLVISRFIVRIVDATVQIDGDVGMLLLLVNGMIALISYRLYKKK